MNVSPITWLLIVAPTAVLAAVLFLFVFEKNDETAALERDRLNIQRLEFDRDFATAWNNERMEAPDPTELAALKNKLVAKERAAEAAEKERCKKMQALSAELENTLKASGGSAEKISNNCE